MTGIYESTIIDEAAKCSRCGESTSQHVEFTNIINGHHWKLCPPCYYFRTARRSLRSGMTVQRSLAGARLQGG